MVVRKVKHETSVAGVWG